MRHRLHALLLALGILGLSAALVYQPKPVAHAAAYRADRSSTMDTYILRGQQAAGLGPDSAYDWQDFMVASASATAQIPWSAFSSGTGAVTTNPNVVGYRGGIFRFTTGATAASRAGLYGNSTDVAHQGTDRWYMAFRFKVQTAITAQTIAYVGLFGSLGNTTIGVGVFGANSTTNFVLQYDGNETGTFLSTGVPIDTAFHVFEIYGQADGKVRLRSDGGTELSATLAGAAADAHGPSIAVKNGTDAVNRNLDADWVLTLSARTP